jgi:catechol 2,3-dioxygenase-like lactoylglutathione lyase family enzyme
MREPALGKIEILFVAGFGPIVADHETSRRLYVDTLGLPLEPMENNPAYLHTQRLQGAKYFALWPLSQASRSCFGTESWPAELRVPQFWLELDVADLPAATEVLAEAGYELLVRARHEPWGQTVTRFLDPDGGLIALTHTPWLRAGHSASAGLSSS